ncbi:MAG: diguanylate cyclase [Ectothiorhodospiraceae bacterium]
MRWTPKTFADRLGIHLGPDVVASSVVYLLAISAVIALTPMAVLRFLRGDHLIGVLDIGIIAVFLGLAVCRWRGGWARWQGIATAVSAVFFGLGMVAFRDANSALWLFPALITLFFVLKPGTAFCGGLITAVLAALVASPAFTPLNIATVIITLVLVDAFVFVFSSQLARMREDLDALASRDPLTGLANRRQLQLDRAGAEGGTRAAFNGVTILDLDHFKAINDAHGHDVGDTILRRIGNILADTLPATAHAYRYGGEEFVILTDSETDPLVLAERVRARIASRGSDSEPAFTASLGCAKRRPNEPLDDCFARADEALYRAKASGRNRVADAQRSNPGESGMEAAGF